MHAGNPIPVVLPLLPDATVVGTPRVSSALKTSR